MISHKGSILEIAIFLGVLLICWNIEIFTARLVDHQKRNHAFLNAKFILSNLPLQLVLGITFIKVIDWTGLHHFGILYLLSYMKHPFVVFITSFVLLDLGEYIYHIIMHKVKRLWMFHAVHHSDNRVDVSTTLREHPGENLVRNSFTLLWVFLTGTVFWAFFFRQLIQTISNLLVHMDYRLPRKIDALLGFLFITPNLHQVHHHFQQPYTDCNYGDVLSIWDRIFGTFRRLPPERIRFGVDAYMNKQENDKYSSLLKIPFGKYRSPKKEKPE